MSFAPKKFDQIYQDMVQETRKRLPDMADFQVGSVIRTMYESFAYEMALLYEQMQQVYQSAYIDTAEGPQLDMLVSVLGIQRGLPDFAEGEVTFERDPGSEAIEIPIGTLVTTQDQDKTPKRAYKTIEAKQLPADQTRINIKVQAVERGKDQVVAAEAIGIMPMPVPGIKSVLNADATKFTGKQAETDAELRLRARCALISSGKASTIAIKSALLSLPGVTEVKLIERFGQSSADQPQSETAHFGVVDVFVDGIDFTLSDRVQYLQGQIDRVRAAGVLAQLKPASIIKLDAVFRLAVNPEVTLSASDRQALEQTVQQALTDYLSQLKMGQTLLFAQLIRQVLSIANINNLEQFQLHTQLEIDGAVQEKSYTGAEREIQVAESQKIQPRRIQVVLQPRPVPLRVQFQAEQVTEQTLPRITDALKQHFSQMEVGGTIKLQDIQSTITRTETTGIATIAPNTLKLIPAVSYGELSPLTAISAEQISLSCIEQAQLVEPVFAYQRLLNLVGAIIFVPPNDTTLAVKRQLTETISDRIKQHLDSLDPEASVDLSQLEQIAEKTAQTIAPTTQITLSSADFQTTIQGNPEIRLNESKEALIVKPLEKIQIQSLLVTSEPQSSVAVHLTELSLKLVLPPELPKGFDRAAATAAIPSAVQQALTQLPLPGVGQTLSWTTLEQTILQPIGHADLQALLRGVTYRVGSLSLTATSAGDGRIQTVTDWNAASPPIHVRSPERITKLVPPVVITIVS